MDTLKPLADGYSVRFVPTTPMHVNGRDTALLIVGEAPGAEEDKQLAPFVGKSGQLLRTAYVDYWKLADHADVYLTNAVRCRPPSNRTPRPAEIKKHREFLEHDIANLQSNYSQVFVLCTGATACKSMGIKSLAAGFKQQGGTLDNGVRFFCTYHPAFVLRDRSVGTALQSHLACLHRALSGGERPEPEGNGRHWMIAPRPQECAIDCQVPVCYDSETYGAVGRTQTQFHVAKMVHWDKVARKDILICGALAWKDSETGQIQSAFFNLREAGHRQRLVAWFKWLHEHDVPLLCQNAGFDLPVTRYCLPAAHKWLRPPLRLVDLLVSSYLVDEVRPEKSLKALAPLMLGQRGLYGDDEKCLNFTAHNDPALAKYNVADVERTLECHLACQEAYPRLYGTNTAKGGTYCQQWYSDLLWLLIHMTEAGVPIDVTGLERLDSELAARKRRLEQVATQQFGLVLEGKGSDKSKRAAVEDVLNLLADRTDICGQVELTPTGKVPYDEETRNLLLPPLAERNVTGPRLGAYAKVKLIGIHQDTSKLLGTYTGPMLRGRTVGKKTINGPRVIGAKAYPTWFCTPREFGNTAGGVKQGRFAAKEPAIQTFPKCVKALVAVDLWADFSGIEWRLAALLSGDPAMIQDIDDPHTRTARATFGDDFVDKFISDQGFSTWKDSVYRQAGKTTNFSMLNLGGADTLRAQLLRKAKFDYPLEKCQAAIRAFWNLYHVLRQYIDDNVAVVRRHGFLELPLIGQSRHFDRNNPPLPEIANLPWQCFAANVTASAQHELWRRAGAAGIGLSVPCNIHDAIGFVLTPAERRRYGTNRVKELMEQVLPNPPFYRDLCKYLGRTVPLAYDVSEAKVQ